MNMSFNDHEEHPNEQGVRTLTMTSLGQIVRTQIVIPICTYSHHIVCLSFASSSGMTLVVICIVLVKRIWLNQTSNQACLHPMSCGDSSIVN
jgi:hypothetical protein